MWDLNKNQMFDIHTQPCAECGKSIPRGIQNPVTKELLCTTCGVEMLHKTEAGTMIGAQGVETPLPVHAPEYVPENVPDPREENVPNFGESKFITDGVCTHCDEIISGSVAQESADGEIYCGACLSWYMDWGELPSDEVMQTRRDTN